MSDGTPSITCSSASPGTADNRRSNSQQNGFTSKQVTRLSHQEVAATTRRLLNATAVSWSICKKGKNGKESKRPEHVYEVDHAWSGDDRTPVHTDMSTQHSTWPTIYKTFSDFFHSDSSSYLPFMMRSRSVRKDDLPLSKMVTGSSFPAWLMAGFMRT